MRYLGGLFLLLLACSGFAQTVQVPENCINKISPCLVHTNNSSFEFIHDGQQVKILKEAIVKISFDEKTNNFEVINGRISLSEQKKTQKVLLINSEPVRGGNLLVRRFTNNLAILDLNDFILSEYQTGPGTLPPAHIKADFINKKDFITFTKSYFLSIGEYKQFLALQAKNWKSEFEKQNSSQTKVLLRAIASEKKNAEVEAEKKRVAAEQLKKVREIFFYRTFER